jgi:LmbE family N-acetylglucosaminyl deacetylase
MTFTAEEWSGTQHILVILAHPDDPDFFCGATIARWTSAGHILSYCLLTSGDKGASDVNLSSEEVAAIREKEQMAAAQVLGVKSVRFLRYPDGYLIPDLQARKDVVRVIRQERPDILVTCDPTNIFPGDAGISHPDHRAAGQIVVDAVFPASGNAFFFPELRVEEGLEPHSIKELWMSVTGQPNMILDVTDTWQMKVTALKEHRSQVGDPEKFEERMRSRRTPDSSGEIPRYEEKFRRFKFG